MDSVPSPRVEDFQSFKFIYTIKVISKQLKKPNKILRNKQNPTQKSFCRAGKNYKRRILTQRQNDVFVAQILKISLLATIVA